MTGNNLRNSCQIVLWYENSFRIDCFIIICNYLRFKCKFLRKH